MVKFVSSGITLKIMIAGYLLNKSLAGTGEKSKATDF